MRDEERIGDSKDRNYITNCELLKRLAGDNWREQTITNDKYD